MMARHKFTQREGMKERMKKVNVFFGKLGGKLDYVFTTDIVELRENIIRSRIPKQLELFRQGKLSKKQESTLIRNVYLYGTAEHNLELIKTGKITNENTQFRLASNICEKGNREDIYQALESDKITGFASEEILVAQLLQDGYSASAYGLYVSGKIKYFSSLSLLAINIGRYYTPDQVLEVIRIGDDISDLAQYQLAQNIRTKGIANQAFKAFILGHIKYCCAQDLLAEKIAESGTAEQSTMLLISGLVTSERAQSLLCENVFYNGDEDQACRAGASKYVVNGKLKSQLLAKFQESGALN